MARKLTEGTSKRGLISKIRPSGGCGGELIPAAVQLEYHRNEFERYLGNVG